jgi:hypothetical protein
MTPEIIDAEHDRLGLTLGWRFLTGPQRALTTADVAIVTLNPRGTARHERTLAESWSCEAGNAYAVESWRGQPPGSDPLQRQILALVSALGSAPDETLMGHFIPFRSARIEHLAPRKEATMFGLRLWRWAAAQSPARLYVCVGKDDAGVGIATAIHASPIEDRPTGWGDVTMRLYRATDGRAVLALPHLSTFKLFSRADCVARVAEAITNLRGPVPSRPAMAPQAAAPLLKQHEAPRSVSAGSGRRFKRGTKRPNEGTVHGLLYAQVPLGGCSESGLITALLSIPHRDISLKARVAASEQGVGSERWWRGYVAGALRRGYIEIVT